MTLLSQFEPSNLLDMMQNGSYTPSKCHFMIIYQTLPCLLLGLSSRLLSVEENEGCLYDVMANLKEHQLYINLSKCLGHIVGKVSMVIDLSKIHAIQGWSRLDGVLAALFSCNVILLSQVHQD